MSSKIDRVSLSAAVPLELKDRLRAIAEKHRWTLSQTLVVFIEEFLPVWEDNLGIYKSDESSPKKRKPKSET